MQFAQQRNHGILTVEHTAGPGEMILIVTPRLEADFPRAHKVHDVLGEVGGHLGQKSGLVLFHQAQDLILGLCDTNPPNPN
jgi:hypothetical protein